MTNLSQHHIKWGKTETIYSKIRNKARVSTVPTLTHIALEFLIKAIIQRIEIKEFK
jgi:hypothetical protein